MVLVDTSIWIDHLRRGDAALTALLERDLVLTHPFVVGELSLGNLLQRGDFLTDLRSLPPAVVANDDETMRLIEDQRLFGLGIGYVDAHLLASARLTRDAALWSRDKRLAAVAERLSIAARVAH